jgi:hypothetical protein
VQELWVVSLNHVSGKPEDRVQNTFCFEYPGAYDPAKDVQIGAALAAFYNTTPTGGTGSLASRIGDPMVRTVTASRQDVYDITGHLDGSPHGSPMATYGWTLAAAGGSGSVLPAEVAITGSFHAAYGNLSEEIGNTRPKSRRRGRIYIGPLRQAVVLQDATTKRAYVDTTAVATLRGAMLDLMNDSNTNWCVWSRRDQLTLSVVGGFVDDGFDTHRSRGERAVTRNTFGVV